MSQKSANSSMEIEIISSLKFFANACSQISVTNIDR